MNTYLIAPDATMIELLRSTVQSQSLPVKSAVVRAEGQPLLPMVQTLEPGILVLCSSQSQLAQDLDALESLTWSNPQVSVVLVSGSDTKEDLVRAMRSGVREVVASPPAQSELIAALRRVVLHHEKTLRSICGVLSWFGLRQGTRMACSSCSQKTSSA